MYELLARGVGLVLTAGQRDASGYVAASVARGDPVYGLSDIDLVIVTADARVVRRRWDMLRRLLGPLAALFSDLADAECAQSWA